MPAIAIQLNVTVTLEPKLRLAPVRGFCLHYVRADSSCDQDRPDGVEGYIRVDSTFFASVFEETPGTHDEHRAASFKQLSDGVFELKLIPITVAVTSSSMPPQPLIQPGLYRLASMQVFTAGNTNYYLSEGTGFPTTGTDVTIPDLSSGSDRGVKVLGLKVSTNEVFIP